MIQKCLVVLQNLALVEDGSNSDFLQDSCDDSDKESSDEEGSSEEEDTKVNVDCICEQEPHTEECRQQFQEEEMPAMFSPVTEENMKVPKEKCKKYKPMIEIISQENLNEYDSRKTEEMSLDTEDDLNAQIDNMKTETDNMNIGT